VIKLCRNIVSSNRFEQFIIFVIIINCLLIGVETYSNNSIIANIQTSALIIFIIEIFIRYTASKSTIDYLKNGWNIFDVSIVIVCLIPESLFQNSETIAALRVLRVFRILRLLRANEEIRLIVAVLVKSVSALFYNTVFFLIFMYLFAIIGTTLFKLPNSETSDPETKKILIEYINTTPNAPQVSPDPYKDLGETFFTLFRVLTGEDWTDIRYNLQKASEMKLIKVSPWIITTYHVLWYIISAFLLLNLLVGAILNNYQIIMDDFKRTKK